MRSLGRDSTRSYLGRSVCVPASKACLKDRAIRVTRFALTEVSRGRSRNLPTPMATRRTKRLVVENNQGRTIHVLEPSKTHASQARTPTQSKVIGEVQRAHTRHPPPQSRHVDDESLSRTKTLPLWLVRLFSIFLEASLVGYTMLSKRFFEERQAFRYRGFELLLPFEL